MDLKDKNVLVTGAGGFVGQNAILRLVKAGARPVCLMRTRGHRTSSGPIELASQHGALFYGDVCDTDFISGIMSRYEIDYVLHLAAISIVGQCDNNPALAYKVNVGGVVSLMEAIRRLKRKPIKAVCMSSDKSFSASSPKGGYKENTPLQVGDAYCTSKACGDMIVRSYAKTFGIPACVVRAGNLYGPRDLNLSRLIPKTIIKILQGERPVLYSHAAAMIREFIYVDDILDVYETLFEKGQPGEAYNVGGTPPRKIKDVIDMISTFLTGDTGAYDIQNIDFPEIQEQFLCADKLRSLGWSAKTSLQDGIEETVDWYRKYLDGSRS